MKSKPPWRTVATAPVLQHVRAAIAESGMTWAKLTEAAGVTPTALNKIIHGKGDVTTATADKVLAACVARRSAA